MFSFLHFLLSPPFHDHSLCPKQTVTRASNSCALLGNFFGEHATSEIFLGRDPSPCFLDDNSCPNAFG